MKQHFINTAFSHVLFTTHENWFVRLTGFVKKGTIYIYKSNLKHIQIARGAKQ